jgi:PKD repeat protein/ligand-binding sensor domain-containing protein/DNA-directed RNA polymerase subunit RPC12/RpoP
MNMKSNFLTLFILFVMLLSLFPIIATESQGVKSKGSILEIVSGSGNLSATAGDSVDVYVVVNTSDTNAIAVLYYRFGTDTLSSMNMSKTSVTSTKYNFTYPISIPRTETRSIEYYVVVNDTYPASISYPSQRDLLIDTDGIVTSEKGSSQDTTPYNFINIAGRSELRYWDSQTTGDRGRYNTGEDIRNGSKNWNYVLNDVDNSCSLWANYTTSNKIAEDYVNVIEVDTVDVWVGTRAGLSRFNRTTGVWITYTTSTTSNKLPHNNINAIALDGNLVWVATSGGPAFYDKTMNMWTNLASLLGIPVSGSYTAVAVDGSKIWFGTPLGLVTYNKSTSTWGGVYATSFGDGHDSDRSYVWSIVIDNDYVWYGSEYGLVKVPKFTITGKNAYSSGRFVKVGDEGDYLWLAKDGGGGGYRFTKGSGQMESITSLQGKSWFSITIATNDTVWFGGVNMVYGVSKLDISLIDPKYSIYPSGTIYSLSLTKDYLWAGSTTGLSRYNMKNNSWDSFASATNIPSNNIQSIATDENGVWFGTDNGASTYSFYNTPNNSSIWKRYTTANGLPANSIYAIGLDGNDVWFGFGSGSTYGIYRYNKTIGKWTQYATTPINARGNAITAITVDSENVWFGTQGGGSSSGVRRYIKDTDSWINYTSSSTGCDVLNKGVNSISRDGDTIWVGTNDKVARFNLTSSSWTTYEKSNGLADNNVRSIAIDGNFVWFGTQNGISRYNKSANTWVTYTTSNGLVNNDVYVVAVDNNNVWIGTSNGVSRYSNDKGTFTTYTTSDGLISNNIKVIAVKGDGIIWFGTAIGATRHDSGRPFTTSDGIYFNDANNNTIWDNGEDIWYDGDGDGAITLEKSFKITVSPYTNKLPEISSNTNFTFALPHPKTNRIINFIGVAKDDDGNITTYTWDFGDESGNWSSNTTGNTTHVYLEPGTYSPIFKVKDNDGGEVQTTLPNITIVNNIVPFVNITLPSVITVKTPLQFYSNGSGDNDGDIVNWIWEFGDGGISYEQNSTHTYTKKGNFTINLTVTDNDNARNTTNKTISIINQKPVITNITLPPNIAIGVPLQYACTANDSDGKIVNYTWNFGDENISYEQNTTHTYMKKGNFAIALTITDDDGENATEVRNILLENIAPTPDITEPVKNTFNTLETINFNASNSSDLDGDTPLTFLWKFDDSFGPLIVTGPNATRAYGKAGTYNITLTVTDNKGASNNTTKIINIMNRPPKPFISVTDITNDNKAVINSTLQFNASDSYDEDGNIIGYQWEIDGYATPWNSTPSYKYTFTVAKTYTVVLRVRDDNNNVSDTQKIITIVPREPTPSIYYNKNVKYKPGEEISFDASNSTAIGASITITSYQWDFGDGVTDKGIQVTHTYSHSGNYSITLYVKDSSGNENKTMINITIENIAPIPVFTAPHSGRVGETITFNASKSTDPYGKITSYIWDFGDGTNATGEVVTHIYKEPWQYRVKLTVIDDNDTSNSTTLDTPLMILSEISGGGGAGDKWALDDPNVIGLIVSGIGFVVGYIAYTAKKRKLSKNIKEVTNAYMRYRHKPEYCEGELNKLREKFSQKFEDGKLDGNNYLILEKKIDNYVKELRTKTVETKMGAVPVQIQQTIGNILADGRISKEEYDGLMSAISSTNMDAAQRKQLEEMFSGWMKSDDQFKHPAEITIPQPKQPTDISKPALTAQRVRCTKCSAIINVTSTKRPLTIYCPKCGMKGILKGKEPREQTKTSTVTCPSCRTEIPKHLLIDGRCPYCGAPINK